MQGITILVDTSVSQSSTRIGKLVIWPTMNSYCMIFNKSVAILLRNKISCHWDFQSSAGKYTTLVEYDTSWIGISAPAFRRSWLFPSSGWFEKSQPPWKKRVFRNGSKEAATGVGESPVPIYTAS